MPGELGGREVQAANSVTQWMHWLTCIVIDYMPGGSDTSCAGVTTGCKACLVVAISSNNITFLPAIH
jgi:hypothetical protein